MYMFSWSSFKGGYLDFSHFIESKNIYITEIYMKKKTFCESVFEQDMSEA